LVSIFSVSVLGVDHQSGLFQVVKDIGISDLRSNVAALAKLGTLLKSRSSSSRRITTSLGFIKALPPSAEGFVMAAICLSTRGSHVGLRSYMAGTRVRQRRARAFQSRRPLHRKRGSRRDMTCCDALRSRLHSARHTTADRKAAQSEIRSTPRQIFTGTDFVNVHRRHLAALFRLVREQIYLEGRCSASPRLSLFPTTITLKYLSCGLATLRSCCGCITRFDDERCNPRLAGKIFFSLSLRDPTQTNETIH
jgi:hypothetical protein